MMSSSAYATWEMTSYGVEMSNYYFFFFKFLTSRFLQLKRSYMLEIIVSLQDLLMNSNSAKMIPSKASVYTISLDRLILISNEVEVSGIVKPKCWVILHC